MAAKTQKFCPAVCAQIMLRFSSDMRGHIIYTLSKSTKSNIYYCCSTRCWDIVIEQPLAKNTNSSIRHLFPIDILKDSEYNFKQYLATEEKTKNEVSVLDVGGNPPDNLSMENPHNQVGTKDPIHIHRDHLRYSTWGPRLEVKVEERYHYTSPTVHPTLLPELNQRSIYRA